MLSRHVRPLWVCVCMMLAVGAAAQAPAQTSPTVQTRSAIAYTPITTATLERNKQARIPAGVAADPRFRLMNREFVKPVNPAIGAVLSTDTQLQYLYSGRPVLIVGTFAGYDRATSTVLVKVDPKLSRFPNAVKVASQQYRVPEDRVMAREFRPERSFRLSADTHVVDDTAPLDLKPGQHRRSRPNIKIEAFKPGDKVTVTYRIQIKADAIPHAYNLSKVDPARTYFSADFDPTRGPLTRRPASPTSGTLTAGRPAAHRPKSPANPAMRE